MSMKIWIEWKITASHLSVSAKRELTENRCESEAFLETMLMKGTSKLGSQSLGKSHWHKSQTDGESSIMTDKNQKVPYEIQKSKEILVNLDLIWIWYMRYEKSSSWGDSRTSNELILCYILSKWVIQRFGIKQCRELQTCESSGILTFDWLLCLFCVSCGNLYFSTFQGLSSLVCTNHVSKASLLQIPLTGFTTKIWQQQTVEM